MAAAVKGAWQPRLSGQWCTGEWNNGTFRNVSVSQLELVGGHYQSFTCNWCGGEGFFGVSRTSVLTGNRYTDYACTECARKWVSPSKEALRAFHKLRWTRMAPGLREQFIERISEARRDICSRMSKQQLRDMMKAARAKRMMCAR